MYNVHSNNFDRFACYAPAFIFSLAVLYVCVCTVYASHKWTIKITKRQTGERNRWNRRVIYIVHTIPRRVTRAPTQKGDKEWQKKRKIWKMALTEVHLRFQSFDKVNLTRIVVMCVNTHFDVCLSYTHYLHIVAFYRRLHFRYFTYDNSVQRTAHNTYAYCSIEKPCMPRIFFIHLQFRLDYIGIGIWAGYN